METATTAGAGAALTSPLWIQTLNPYVQFTVAILGGVWLAVKIFTHLYDWYKNDRPNQTD